MQSLLLDIGGTAVKYAIICEDKAEYGSFPVKEKDGTENLPKRIKETFLIKPFSRVGVCAPGPFDFKTGTSKTEHKLPSLYGVSLAELFKKENPLVEVMFIHDSTAFALGAMTEMQKLKNEKFCAVMIGTGLGYTVVENGKVLVREDERPIRALWQEDYKNGKVEAFVSATAMIKKAKEKGYNFNGVYEMSLSARKGEKLVKEIFFETGRDLGEILSEKKKEDGFNKIVIGGNVALSFDLMESGFKSKCNVEYDLVKNPSTCALNGLAFAIENGKEKIYGRKI